MNKEQLALEKYPVAIKGDGQRTSTSDYDFGMDVNLECREAFIAGYEAKEADSKWIEFNKETSKLLNTLTHVIYLFDNGEVRRRFGEHPFAIMTHFLPLPNPPKQ